MKTETTMEAPLAAADGKTPRVTTQVIGTALGEPLDHGTFSGIPRNLFLAIRGHGNLAAAISNKIVTIPDLFTGAVKFKGFRKPGLSRHWLWKESTTVKLSERLEARAAQIHPTAPILQIGTHVYPTGDTKRSYYSMTDMTIQQAADANQFGMGNFSASEIEQMNRVQRKIFDAQRGIFVSCQWTKESVVDDYGQSPDRVVVLGVGTNMEALDAAEDKYTKPSILFVGFDWERKGGPLLLETFRHVHAQLPEAVLHIVGCTPETSDPGVDIVGPLQRGVPAEAKRLENLYRSATCFSILPSFDPFPNVLLEAQYTGTPVVSLDEGSRRDAMIPGETGLLVAERDPEALAAAFVEILGNAERARTMGEAGRRFISETFTWPIIAGKVLDTIHAIETS